MSWRREWADLGRAAARPAVLARSARVALVVGTILTAVNHPDLFTGQLPDTVGAGRIVVSYLVPFCVSTWSAAAQSCAPRS